MSPVEFNEREPVSYFLDLSETDGATGDREVKRETENSVVTLASEAGALARQVLEEVQIHKRSKKDPDCKWIRVCKNTSTGREVTEFWDPVVQKWLRISAMSQKIRAFKLLLEQPELPLLV